MVELLLKVYGYAKFSRDIFNKTIKIIKKNSELTWAELVFKGCNFSFRTFYNYNVKVCSTTCRFSIFASSGSRSQVARPQKCRNFENWCPQSCIVFQ